MDRVRGLLDRIIIPWPVQQFFIWIGYDNRHQWFRVNLREAHHKMKLDSDGHCVRCD